MGAQWLLCPCPVMVRMLVLSSLFSLGLCLPLEGIVNQGPQLGPLTPAHGDLVQTPRGLASLHLEGFSEDLNEDGYVDPVAQAAPVAHVVAAPALTHQQVVAAPPAPVAHQVAHQVAPHYQQPALAYAAAPTYSVPQVAAHQVVAHAGRLNAAPAVATPAVAAPAVAVAAHHVPGLCHNHLGSAVPCAL